MITLKIEVEPQTETNVLIQQDMGWWSVRIARVMDMSRIRNVNVAQSVGALGLLKRNQNKMRIHIGKILDCQRVPDGEACSYSVIGSRFV